MMPTRMWQEIQDQYDVALRLTGTEPVALTGIQRLILAGTGASLAACRAGQYAFMKYAGLLPHVLPAAELEYVAPAPGTLVILVSQSGASLETQTATLMLKERGISFWGVTNNLQSPLAQAADRVLWLNAGDEISSATKTYTATLLHLVRLAGGVIRHVADDIRATLAAAAEPVERWAEALLEQQVGYILGMGPLAATAAVGALLMKEKALMHVEGMSVSEFRHGNIEVVRPGLPILMLAATPDAVAEAVQHARYFASLGADVYLVSDAPVHGMAPERVLQVSNQGDEVVGAIPAVIPLQLLAERIAVRKGYAVDGFRFIAKVVDKYAL